jgi:D-alanyl-D-alanine carboxypeptidase
MAMAVAVCIAAVTVTAASMLLRPGAAAPDGVQPSATEGPAAGAGARVDAYMAAEMATRQIPGASIAVVRDGAVVYSASYGKANVELSAPVTRDSVFKLASLTKPFTATAILLLVRDGRVALDGRLAQYLSNLPSQWADVTIRQLLSHTSGVTDYLKAPGWSWRSSWRQDFTLDEFVAFAAQAPPAFAPGQGIAYSNTGYYLLGMLIEKVSGRSYEQFVSERILRPLQMNATRRDTPIGIVPNRVSGYTFTGGELQNAEYTSQTWAYSEGGLVSTAVDLAKWAVALSGDTLLDRSTRDSMWTASTLRDGRLAVIGDNGEGKPNYYGLGWYISEQRGRRIVLHGGTKPGFSTVFTRFLDDRLTIIVLCNSSSGSPAFALSLGIADVYLPSVGVTR